MIKSKNFLVYLGKKEFKFFSGVPCSFVKDALAALQNNKDFIYVPAVKEDIALGICSGGYLAGKNTAIIIQNSGLGHIVNALTSFNLIYKIPVLIFVTWRGYLGKDAPEHKIMGRKTTTLLKCLDIPYRILSDGYKKDIDWAIKMMQNKKIPVALIIKEGVLK